MVGQVHPCRVPVNNHQVHLACRQCGHGQRPVGKAFRLLDVAGDVNVPRSSVLNADSPAPDIVPAPDGRTFGNDDHLGRLHVGNGKIHLFPAFRSHRDSGGRHIRLAGNHGRNHGIEAHVFNHQFLPGASGYFPHDLRINAHDGVFLPELIGRERGLRHHQDSAVIRRGGSGTQQAPACQQGSEAFQKMDQRHGRVNEYMMAVEPLGYMTYQPGRQYKIDASLYSGCMENVRCPSRAVVDSAVRRIA